MPTTKDIDVNENSGKSGQGEYALVPDDAIVKPEDERPVKTQMRPEENLEEREADIESGDTGSEDMDGDGSPD
ncbi:MAG TPA: hypothetical protein VE521_03350 [Nitrososphaera sp.]|jgi:hypothetical protein|nr:hypothetical protein [Nitrososphaera sp.]